MRAKEIEWVLRGLPTRNTRVYDKLKNKGRPRLTLRHLNALRKQREALKLEKAARACNLKIMVGCMFSTSLGIAPNAVITLAAVGSAAKRVVSDSRYWLLMVPPIAAKSPRSAESTATAANIEMAGSVSETIRSYLSASVSAARSSGAGMFA